MKLEDILASDTLIPSLPKPVAQLLREFQHEEPDVRLVNELLSSEVGLTVRILRLVNSARYLGGSRRIGTVEEATALLGLQATRQLVSAAAAGGAFGRVPGVDMVGFWQHSLDVAKIAQSLAEELGMDKGTAFTAGLLHGAGDLIMKMAMPDRPSLQPAFATDDDRHAAQLADLGYSYADVGAAFTARWLFPDSIVDAVRFQCDPTDGGDSHTLSGVLYLAAWSARAHALDIEGTALLDDFPQTVADAIGLADSERLRSEDPIEWTGLDEAQGFV